LIFVHNHRPVEAGLAVFRPPGPGGFAGPAGPDLQDEGDEMDGPDELDVTDEKAKPLLTFSRYQF
jgi:hypothetical protein